MLTRGARRMRAVAAVLLVVLAAAGTLYGQDDHFPFAPMRMFSTRTAPDGEVRAVALRGQVAGDPSEVELSMAAFGLRRAELEGQLGRLAQPGMLAELVRSREAVRADLPRLDTLRLVHLHYVLRDGKQIDLRETTVAQWAR